MAATRRLGAPALALLALVTWLTPASAQVVQPDFWGTDGRVTSIARVGNTIYLGGEFTMVGPSTGGGAPLDPASGAPLWPFPRVAGIVRVVVPDGAGGWFIGGDFPAVEGVPRSNLAHLLADGSVAPWEANVTDPGGFQVYFEPNPNAAVSALALKGNTLYVGGRFIEIGGQPRNCLAAVDATTGEVLPWTSNTDGPVTMLSVRANTLYVGGRFTTIGGRPRGDIAAVDAATGVVTSWNPTADGAVLTIAFSGKTAFVGGEFSNIGGQRRNSIAALDLETGAATPWDASLQPLRRYPHNPFEQRIWPFVSSLVVRGSTLYAGGDFDSIGGQARRALAQLELASATPAGFDARMGSGYVKALALHANTLYVGGYLYSIGGASRPNIAALDARSGEATAFDPRANGIVGALATSGNAIYAGGDFTSLHDWQPRSYLAALDAATGTLLPWSPRLDSPRISSMIGTATTLYIAGAFTQVDGQPRGHLASFDGATGALTSWNPWSNQVTPGEIWHPYGTYPIQSMAMIGNTIYVGGFFNQFNGVPRHCMAAVDATTGSLLNWAPNPRWGFRSMPGKVQAMGVRGDTLFVAGLFDSIGGAQRRELAALDGRTGLAYPWDTQPGFNPLLRPSWPEPLVRALAAGDQGVFLGGWFTRIIGVNRISLAAFDAKGALLPWDSNMDADYGWITGIQPGVRDLLVRGGTLFVAGRFDQIGGRRIRNLVALDAATGMAADWDPDLDVRHGDYDGAAETLCLSGDMLYVGGSFHRLGGFPCAGFAAVSLAPRTARRAEPAAAPEAAAVFSLAAPMPNPARSEALLAFSLPEPVAVTLSVFDLQGRRVALPLERVWLSAGPHDVRVPTAGWRAGCYFCRLEAAGTRLTKRMVVVR